MNSIIYQIKVSDPSKCGNPSLADACFSDYGDAAGSLAVCDFIYSEDSGLWHNGATEAWITKLKVRKNLIYLGKEEVQLR